MKEVWKQIPGYEGYYEVSDQGRVQSLDRIVQRENVGRGSAACRKGRLLRPHINRGNYYMVGLNLDGERQGHYVHVLVAQAFLGFAPKTGHQVNHLDLDKLNNNLSNLEIVTPKGNTRHAVAQGLWHAKTNKKRAGTYNPNLRKKYTPEQIREVKILLINHSYAEVESLTGVASSTVGDVARNKIWVDA